MSMSLSLNICPPQIIYSKTFNVKLTGLPFAFMNSHGERRIEVTNQLQVGLDFVNHFWSRQELIGSLKSDFYGFLLSSLLLIPQRRLQTWNFTTRNLNEIKNLLYFT